MVQQLQQQPNETTSELINIFFLWYLGALFECTFGNVSSNMSTMAASRYSRHASAFFDICSASALALTEIANASASPRIFI